MFLSKGVTQNFKNSLRDLIMEISIFLKKVLVFNLEYEFTYRKNN